MGMLDIILGNKSLQNSLLEKFTGMAAESGMKKIIVDFSTGKPEVIQMKESEIVVDAETYNFYMNFFEENKNLITK